jgi:heat-inducible transcriptional repressor
MAIDLDERSQSILKAIVLSYIRTAYPVGSRNLTKSFDFGLSPASIRSIMADLEEMGYLAQPHPSAGRVPTEKGYRFYVNGLLDVIDQEKIMENFGIEQYQIQKTEDIKQLFQETSKLLSMHSHYAGIVLTPKFANMFFQHLQFIKIRKYHILIVFVSMEGLIQTKVIETEKDFSQQELDRFSFFLNDRFKGIALQEIQSALLNQMKEDKEQYSRLLQKVLDLVNKAFQEAQGKPLGEELFLEGTVNILDLPEFANVEKMKALFKAFEEKYIIMKLLDSCFNNEGVQVFIGSENAYLGINDCSLVITNYKRGSQVLGALGIIGPTRMEYSKVIPLVDYTAKWLGQVLAQMD